MVDNIKTSADLIELCVSNTIVIYGAGTVADLFYKALRQRGMNNCVKCFVTSNGGGGTIDGKPILALNDLYACSNLLICVAVHESIKDDLLNNLISLGFSNCIWVQPFLTSLFYGDPIFDGAKYFKVNALIRKNVLRGYDWAIRFLAMDCYFKKNKNGYNLYLELLCTYSRLESAKKRLESAKKRLESFIELIKKVECNGYDERFPISVFENMIQLDGYHRLAVAKYFGLKKIPCVVYKNGDAPVVPCTETVLNTIYDKAEIAQIKAVNGLLLS